MVLGIHIVNGSSDDNTLVNIVGGVQCTPRCFLAAKSVKSYSAFVLVNALKTRAFVPFCSMDTIVLVTKVLLFRK